MLENAQEIKKFLRANFDKGVKCPSCGQLVKRYERKVTSSMAYGLIVLCRNFKIKQVFHMENFFKSQKDVPAAIRGDMAKFKYWGLIVPVGEKKEDGNPHSGCYELSENAFSFVHKESKIPRYVYLYNNRCLGFSDELVDISEALGSRFNYRELMAN